MLADAIGGRYSGACVIVLYGRRFGKEDALRQLTERATQLGLRLTITRITPSRDIPTDAGAAPNSTSDADDATMEFGAGP